MVLNVIFLTVEYIYNSVFNSNILVARKKISRKTTFLPKLGINKLFSLKIVG